MIGNYAGMHAGDYDHNGIINVTDFNAWISNNAAVGDYLPWDGDCNALINVLDFNLWDSNKSKVQNGFEQ